MEYYEAKKAYQKVRNISGWFSEEAALVLALTDTVQKQHQFSGDIFEIGVHHGKSALYLHHLLSGQENLKVCDLFGNQSGNVSDSGSGDKQIFLSNCSRVIGNVAIPVFEKLSGELSVSEIGRTYRMFHIDGGHSCEEALADLYLAKQATKEYGIIILDDPFRHEWPGVTEAAIEFLKESPDYSALLVGFNKLLIVHNSFWKVYTQAFDNLALRSQYGLEDRLSFKTMRFVGHELRCIYRPTYLQNPTLKVRMYQWLKRLGLR
ncbi:class I SAM-dependent methyltransferase [Telluribacter humicola]|uniref:class I SAM-dependent methyltransferase n=1 Tax=Telluribacter humicola TaxID=1720261 RepID=UPI001A96BBFA|nr:class I SAM-dependent methyltransferase [Telluribacter humicola]